MKTLAAAFLSGLVFAVGLGVSGMTAPAKVIGFLDFFGGHWDPSLALVMAGAICVHLPLHRLIRARPGSLALVGTCGPLDDDQPRSAGSSWASVDGSTVVGAAIFGVGWGLGGYCPGPAVVSVAAAAQGVLVFVAAMLVGMQIFDSVFASTRAARTGAEDAQGRSFDPASGRS